LNKEPQNLSNLTVRVITALVLLPVVLVFVFLGWWTFALLALVFAVLALLEFYALGRDRATQGSVLVGLPITLSIFIAFLSRQYVLLLPLFVLAAVAAFLLETIRRTPEPRKLYRVASTLAGIVYIGIPSAFLVAIRSLPDGVAWLLLALIVTWGTDTLAYVGGRLWGRTPLAPRISPKKTREGAAVGVLGGFLLGLIWLALAGKLTVATLILVVIAPPVAVLGDLFESRIKRFFHAGDSHLAGLNLIPGHGGVLDRIDSLIWVATLCYLYLRLSGVGG
jgi:phosphatidate cytidylyltransferase